MAPYALVAEFDLQRAALYRKVLDAHGVESFLVRDGDAARRVLEHRGPPILLITDLSLPQTDGFSLMADVRRTATPEQAAILVFSAFGHLRAAAWDRRNALGICEVGDKRLSVSNVSQAVARALASVQQQRADPAMPDRDQPEELLQKILFRTSKSFRVPVVLLSIEVGEIRRFLGYANLKERGGVPHQWAPVHQVVSTREPLFVPDLSKYTMHGIDPDMPRLAITGFASVPLTTSNNDLIGVISLLDFQPLTLSAQQLDLFVATARRIADELAQRYLPQTPAESATQLRSEEKWAALERLALTDPLTGLSNRRAGERALEREVARSRRTGSPLSLALLDLDHFKQVNDDYGHSTGDRMLCEVGRILTSAFRASDLAVRWGGDEFLILLPDVGLLGAVAFAERARSQLAALRLPEARSITMSAGIVQLRPGEEPRVAIVRADSHLYEAKRGGRNRVEGSNASGMDNFSQEGSPLLT